MSNKKTIQHFNLSSLLGPRKHGVRKETKKERKRGGEGPFSNFSFPLSPLLHPYAPSRSSVAPICLPQTFGDRGIDIPKLFTRIIFFVGSLHLPATLFSQPDIHVIYQKQVIHCTKLKMTHALFVALN